MPRQTETTKIEATIEKIEKEKERQNKRIPNIPNNPLKMEPKEYYYGTLRPLMTGLGLEVKTDEELLFAISQVVNRTDWNINKLDGYAINEMREDFQMLIDALNPKYFVKDSVIALSEQKKEKIRHMLDKIKEFYLILQEMKPAEEKETEKKERIGYDEDNERNEDYPTRNINTLDKPVETQRIPNVPLERYNI